MRLLHEGNSFSSVTRIADDDRFFFGDCWSSFKFRIDINYNSVLIANLKRKMKGEKKEKEIYHRLSCNRPQ
jgi:hypothetical protein